MKRVNHLIEPIADPDNLRLAFWKASMGKRHTSAVLKFQADLDHNLFQLRTHIQEGRVQVGKYSIFTIYEPKERKICASAFPEQVLHHALMNVCHDYFERKQIYDSYASRIGKGSHAAIRRAMDFHRQNAFYLKLDVRKFFASVHHQVIMDQLKRLFKDKILLGIFYQIIDSYSDSPQRGLPIGSLCSQYLANHYLCGLDHYIKEALRMRAYVRYMDDMVLWHRDKPKLKDALAKIEEFVDRDLRCSLKPIQLNKTTHGLPFLGFRFFPSGIRLNQQSKRRFIRKFRILETKYHQGEWDEATCQRRGLPLLAFIQQGDTEALLRRI